MSKLLWKFKDFRVAKMDMKNMKMKEIQRVGNKNLKIVLDLMRFQQ